MTFREGETNRFPFENTDRKIWYGIIILDYDAKPISFSSAKSGKRDLLTNISDQETRGNEIMLLGIWQGNWKTDIFILDKELTIKKLKEVI